MRLRHRWTLVSYDQDCDHQWLSQRKDEGPVSPPYSYNVRHADIEAGIKKYTKLPRHWTSISDNGRLFSTCRRSLYEACNGCGQRRERHVYLWLPEPFPWVEGGSELPPGRLVGVTEATLEPVMTSIGAPPNQGEPVSNGGGGGFSH